MNNDPIMRIANSGEVGIGVSPYTGTQLTVANLSGNAYIDSRSKSKFAS